MPEAVQEKSRISAFSNPCFVSCLTLRSGFSFLKILPICCPVLSLQHSREVSRTGMFYFRWSTNRWCLWSAQSPLDTLLLELFSKTLPLIIHGVTSRWARLTPEKNKSETLKAKFLFGDFSVMKIIASFWTPNSTLIQ